MKVNKNIVIETKFNYPTLEIEVGVESNADRDAYMKQLDVFMTTCLVQSIKNIEESLTARRTEEFHRHSHSLKGAAS